MRRHREAGSSVSKIDPPWDVAADVLLQCAAVGLRLDRDRPPDPLAGLKVDDADLSVLLSELPGLQGRSRSADSDKSRRLDEALEVARDQLAEALILDKRFSRLVGTARLSELESLVFAVLCAVEADPRRQRLVGYLNDDVTQRRLTVWTLGTLFNMSEELTLAISPGGGLRRAALLAAQIEGPWAAMPIAAANAVLWWLEGGNHVDPDLPPGFEMRRGPDFGSADLVTVASSDRSRRIECAMENLVGTRFLVSKMPVEPPQWDALIRQATLLDAGVVIETDEGLSVDARDRIERANHLSWAVTSPSELALESLFRRPWLEPSVTSVEASDAEWSDAFPDRSQRETEDGPTYHLTADQLSSVRQAAHATGGDLAAAVRRLAAGHIETTATRVRPSRTWDDIVLDELHLEQVREIAIRHRRRRIVFDEWGFSPHPSTGIIALFAGPSGTGKTLAAEIVAGDIGVDLYKVDLSNLVSKYIGETEKNLSRVFEAAEASRVVLFFDEADALLGRRSEVSDAHDRYANIEVAYLLQRLESYDGIVVLATNMMNNLDPAFLRRLHVVVEFAMPQAAERRLIWAHSIPDKAPVADDIDLDRLAELVEVSGGTIHNVVNRAAFLAADASSPISMEIILTALRRELEKIGRLANSSEWLRVFESTAKKPLSQ